jgi:hypothetical protein
VCGGGERSTHVVLTPPQGSARRIGRTSAVKGGMRGQTLDRELAKSFSYNEVEERTDDRKKQGEEKVEAEAEAEVGRTDEEEGEQQ